MPIAMFYNNGAGYTHCRSGSDSVINRRSSAGGGLGREVDIFDSGESTLSDLDGKCTGTKPYFKNTNNFNISAFLSCIILYWLAYSTPEGVMKRRKGQISVTIKWEYKQQDKRVTRNNAISTMSYTKFLKRFPFIVPLLIQLQYIP